MNAIQRSIDPRIEQRMRASVAEKAFMQATRELLAARALGRDLNLLYLQLEVLHTVELREREALYQLEGILEP